MRRLRSIHLRKLITFVLGVSVSVCCCHAHSLVDGFSTSADDLESAVAAEAGGCCVNCTEDDSGRDEPQTPTKSCKSCCVKGTGLKDGVTLPPITVADALPLPAETPSLLPIRASMTLERLVSTPPFVEPRTLVRLHCALIV